MDAKIRKYEQSRKQIDEFFFARKSTQTEPSLLCNGRIAQRNAVSFCVLNNPKYWYEDGNNSAIITTFASWYGGYTPYEGENMIRRAIKEDIQPVNIVIADGR